MTRLIISLGKQASDSAADGRRGESCDASSRCGRSAEAPCYDVDPSTIVPCLLCCQCCRRRLLWQGTLNRGLICQVSTDTISRSLTGELISTLPTQPTSLNCFPSNLVFRMLLRKQSSINHSHAKLNGLRSRWQLYCLGWSYHKWDLLY
jgi:hypothetical protein